MRPTFVSLVLAALAAATAMAQTTQPLRSIEQRQQDFLSWKFGLFLHFNIGTYANLEWAGGYEEPAIFDPTALDCGQWADAAKSAGMKYAVLTVKHTDGFCLWDSKYTTRDVASASSFKHGQGDVVREFVDAFRARGLKVGFYYCFPGDYTNVSWGTKLPEGRTDLHGLPAEAAGDYVGFIHKQLEELLTRYGPIDILWCDQYANKYTGQKWQETLKLIHILQPNCLVIANNSQDFRDTDIISFEFPLGKEHFPAEDNKHPGEVCDTLTGGWFWHPESDAGLRSAKDVVDRLKLCNQRNTNYLLNCGPDRTGRLSDASVKRMAEIGKQQASEK